MDEVKRPNLFEQMKSLGEAVKNWTVKDGLHTVSPKTLEFRKDTCNSCEHWDKEAFGGIGKCKVCGCSAAKLYIPSSACPLQIPKWKAVASVDEKGNPTYSTLNGGRKTLAVINKTQSSGSIS